MQTQHEKLDWSEYLWHGSEQTAGEGSGILRVELQLRRSGSFGGCCHGMHTGQM